MLLFCTLEYMQYNQKLCLHNVLVPRLILNLNVTKYAKLQLQGLKSDWYFCNKDMQTSLFLEVAFVPVAECASGWLLRGKDNVPCEVVQPYPCADDSLHPSSLS